MTNSFFKEMPLSSGDTKWIIELNRYERDNLLALINAIGWPAVYGQHVRVVMPDPAIAAYNSGDWVGQIGMKLMRSDGEIVIDEQDKPNYVWKDDEK
jgi:hypothetical protein